MARDRNNSPSSRPPDLDNRVLHLLLERFQTSVLRSARIHTTDEEFVEVPVKLNKADLAELRSIHSGNPDDVNAALNIKVESLTFLPGKVLVICKKFDVYQAFNIDDFAHNRGVENLITGFRSSIPPVAKATA